MSDGVIFCGDHCYSKNIFRFRKRVVRIISGIKTWNDEEFCQNCRPLEKGLSVSVAEISRNH
jgi:hypothetical protein